jgi:hypothetical protein
MLQFRFRTRADRGGRAQQCLLPSPKGVTAGDACERAGRREPAGPQLLGAVTNGSAGYRGLALAGAHLDAPGVP